MVKNKALLMTVLSILIASLVFSLNISTINEKTLKNTVWEVIKENDKTYPVKVQVKGVKSTTTHSYIYFTFNKMHIIFNTNTDLYGDHYFNGVNKDCIIDKTIKIDNNVSNYYIDKDIFNNDILTIENIPLGATIKNIICKKVIDSKIIEKVKSLA